ncbi:PREDICTED: uncharacterized protein LOC105361661 [Ceratosolen solmsi marchali]|uniref:Uncharacterized protein LOC105361661 n=1 Tax=Ceratosolen solmsi marchali TaxID=326594 RepID=A0AAJ6YFP2_9HYME|nr:PREDICTED: uncharacterized protein LOC105361661 [Ceratosolen solmsi marchali]
MASMNFEFEKFQLINAPLPPAKKKQGQSLGSKAREDESAAEPTKCRYKSTVLVGNWFNQRATYERPSNDWLTIYATTYICKTNPALKKDRIALSDNKTKAEHGLGSEFLIKEYGNTFENNFTTTNDLFFRIIPKGLYGKQVRKFSGRKNKWLPEIDLTKNFGNLTKFCLNKKSESTSTEQEKRRFKPKGKMNEPYLNHLDIDCNLPFQSHLIKGSI